MIRFFLLTLVSCESFNRMGSAILRNHQPILEAGTANSNNDDFAVAAGSDEPPRPPGYRNAWDDCGGVGASATERMRTIASKVKGFAKPIPFKRNAAQDCSLDMGEHGTNPGPGNGVVYPRLLATWGG